MHDAMRQEQMQKIAYMIASEPEKVVSGERRKKRRKPKSRSAVRIPAPLPSTRLEVINPRDQGTHMYMFLDESCNNTCHPIWWAKEAI